MQSNTKLAAPGAGLPKLELFFVRIFFVVFLRKTNLSKLRLKIEAENKLILSLLKDIEPKDCASRVLIPRIMGIEDSSRNWSIGMTLQHLVITTNGMLDIAKELLNGVRPTIVVKIEDVKPTEDFSVNVPEQFQAAVKRLVENTLTDKTLNTKLTHKHPWFGQLSAKGWIYLAAIHIGIHRRQIAMIKALLFI